MQNALIRCRVDEMWSEYHVASYLPQRPDPFEGSALVIWAASGDVIAFEGPKPKLVNFVHDLRRRLDGEPIVREQSDYPPMSKEVEDEGVYVRRADLEELLSKLEQVRHGIAHQEVIEWKKRLGLTDKD